MGPGRAGRGGAGADVCYDRRRLSPSDAGHPQTAADMVADLRTMLTALGIGPPYVPVGHSWGGVIARAFAHALPAEVVGLVLVDATHESIDSKALALLPLMYAAIGLVSRVGAGRQWFMRQICPPSAPSRYRARLEQRFNDRDERAISLRTARSEGAGIRDSLAALRRDCPGLPPIPVRVLTAGGVTGPNVKAIRRVHEAWQAAAGGAANARYTNAPSSSHYMAMDVPGVVIDAIASVLDTVTT